MREHEKYDHFDEFDDNPDARRSRRRRFDDEPQPRRTGRLTLEERGRLARDREAALVTSDLPAGADRWSTWGSADHGPHPRPDWLVTDLSAADYELGVIKTGKEADVSLIRRALGLRECLLAAKRYRSSEHRLFHRDAGYLEGRRMRRSRETRAIANRTAFGRNLIAEQWAVAEFAALTRLWSVGAPVPYPVQRDGTELLMEYLAEADGSAAPRLAQLRPSADELSELWHQLTATLDLLASQGVTHGDLSAYNILVLDGQLMLIDMPQLVDVVANPSGAEFLARDVANIARWFHARGMPEAEADPGALTADLIATAGMR
ncbi:RIO kinase 1 [Herbihabitans rhizosphaerae]|uniref:non-specific serine/threonine protein kinase n=1 Tax=Herbihabitans rhizosphaerae TaxID=1872711 RepID=A0A4Q7KE59_9PSEU|nr:RIO1 family regulatory kinase/ATPase [Herbihabitans rhizosphaerae]RZS32525.1 RIO kinase 1 [Herbihabitans rhizosphaerae]